MCVYKTTKARALSNGARDLLFTSSLVIEILILPICDLVIITLMHNLMEQFGLEYLVYMHIK